jgi:hypothetical protein
VGAHASLAPKRRHNAVSGIAEAADESLSFHDGNFTPVRAEITVKETRCQVDMA